MADAKSSLAFGRAASSFDVRESDYLVLTLDGITTYEAMASLQHLTLMTTSENTCEPEPPTGISVGRPLDSEGASLKLGRTTSLRKMRDA